MSKKNSQKHLLVAGLLLWTIGLFGIVADLSNIFAYLFLAGFLTLSVLFLYKLVRVSQGKEKWGVF